MKSSTRLLALLGVVLVVLVILNAFPYLKAAWNALEPGHATPQASQLSLSTPSTIPGTASITVKGQQWGKSTCFIGATEGSSRFNVADLVDLGMNSFHMYGGMPRWEAQDDSKVYGYPTIAQIKADPKSINWQHWDAVMTNPPGGSDYWWEPAPRWQGNARTLFSQLNAANMRIILDLRNQDEQNRPSWAPNPPQTIADWNEWWEHVFATVYWLDVRNAYHVTDFEIHNEPNIRGQGWTPQATEAEYFTFVKYTNDAISYVFHTYLPGQAFHVYAPATSESTWPKDALYQIPQYFDSMDVHIYGDFRSSVEKVHGWMDQAGYAKEPLWVTEWGSYQHQYDSVPFGMNLVNGLIYGSFPGNDYVYGSSIFSLYDYSTSTTGLIDYKGHRRADYYAMRLGIRALQGCRSTYQSITSNKDLLAITTMDTSKSVYLLVTNKSSRVSYTVDADLSQLLSKASGVMWQFDSRHMDTVTGNLALIKGNISLTIPATSAVLIKLTPTSA